MPFSAGRSEFDSQSVTSDPSVDFFPFRVAQVALDTRKTEHWHDGEGVVSAPSASVTLLVR